MFRVMRLTIRATEDLRSSWQLDRVFEPDPAGRSRSQAAYALWQKAVERSKGWAQD